MKQSLIVLSLSLVFSSVSAAAHDGKVFDQEPGWYGRSWRRGVDASQDAPNFSWHKVILQSLLTLDQFGPGVTSTSSGWGYTSPSGREYALVCLNNGTAFVEVTDAANAQVIAHVAGPVSMWRDVRTYSHYAYAISEGGGGVQVIDLAQIDSGVVALVNTVGAGGSPDTHTLCINEHSGFLYRSGGGNNNGLRAYSLANPANPTYVGQWTTRYVHEATVISYTTGPYAGREIAFACSGYNTGWTQTGIDVLDVTNKSSIVSLSRAFWPSAVYSHQCWPSEDRKYLYVNDEKDEGNFGLPTRTLVIDIQDLANPQYVGSFTNGSSAIGHNLYVRGNLIFEANYRSGLRIFDASASQTSPTEIAWFDTVATDDYATFASLWNVYPYFASGTVTGTDIQKGLIVWHVPGLPGPTTYCTPKPNSQGCLPSIAGEGAASWSGSQTFTITATNELNNKWGLLFYGVEPSSAPFHGGTLCVAPPHVRTTLQTSGGTSAPAVDCSGAFAFDFNTYLMSGADPSLAPAVQVRCQYWSRDPADASGFADSLSDALWFSIGV